VEESDCSIEDKKRYKLQIQANDSTLFEFVFLIDIDPRAAICIQFSRRACYISPKRLSGDNKVKIGGVEVPAPYPLSEYVSCCCGKEDREAGPSWDIADERPSAEDGASDLCTGSPRQIAGCRGL
jgi:hypothetical protein